MAAVVVVVEANPVVVQVPQPNRNGHEDNLVNYH